MEIKALLRMLPLGITFLFTGLTVNCIQAACYLVIRPVSKKAYRMVIGMVTEILWLHIMWLLDWWANFEVQLYTDKNTYELMGKEHALVVPNHLGALDTILVWLMSQRVGCLRSSLTVVKKSTLYLPIFGWAAWFFEFIFLDRRWEKDGKKLKSAFEGLRDYPRPFWLTMFVEGTRMGSDNLLQAQNFAVSRGLHIPNNVLIPRTKGFVAAVQYLRSFVPAIYDITIVVPKGDPIPCLLRLFLGKPSVVKLHVKRYSIKELPESDEGIAQWCRDIFVAKDNMIKKFLDTGSFEDEQIKSFNRSLRTTIIPMMSTSVVFLWIGWSVLSTWKGCAFLAMAAVSSAFIMHWMLEFTKVPPQKASLQSPWATK